MKVAFGVSWEDSKKAALGLLLVPVLMLSMVTPAQRQAMAQSAADAVDEMVSVIVRELPGAGSMPEQLVKSLGGTVERQIGIIDGFSAQVPQSSLRVIRATAGIHSVTKNYPLQMMQLGGDGSLLGGVSDVLGSDGLVGGLLGSDESGSNSSNSDSDSDVPTADTADGDYDNPAETGIVAGSMYDLQKATGAREYWRAGYCGQNVDVAMIDTGVVPVNGLTFPGKIVNGPDISFETINDGTRYLDTNGHGTHMAGIIAGRDNDFTVDDIDHETKFVGMAPCSRIVSVKVGNALGATDVSQVLAAIDWVVQHKRANGMRIKVLNLSFGTDGTQSYLSDPLTYAVEVAWKKGITVVVAAGNQQFGNTAMNNPAYDPYVIAVGANETKGTYGVSDDAVPDWSARGDGNRNPDVVAPGKSVISLRNPGSHIDMAYGSTGQYGERFFKGSGTSQAAAAVSGAAALILSQRPHLTPDQVKGLLMETAQPLPNADIQAQGRGMIDMAVALNAPDSTFVQNHTLSNGKGKLQLSRGTLMVKDPNGVQLTGEKDIFGNTWNGTYWKQTMGRGWNLGIWNFGQWSGTGFGEPTWSGVGWSGVGWSGVGWSGVGWSGVGWSGVGWSGVGWSGVGWSGVGWSGVGWSGVGWSGVGWSGVGWSGVGWSGVGWSGVGWS